MTSSSPINGEAAAILIKPTTEMLTLWASLMQKTMAQTRAAETDNPSSSRTASSQYSSLVGGTQTNHARDQARRVDLSPAADNQRARGSVSFQSLRQPSTALLEDNRQTIEAAPSYQLHQHISLVDDDDSYRGNADIELERRLPRKPLPSITYRSTSSIPSARESPTAGILRHISVRNDAVFIVAYLCTQFDCYCYLSWKRMNYLTRHV